MRRVPVCRACLWRGRRLIPAAFGYQPAQVATRAVGLSMIAAVHAVAIAVLASLGGVKVVMQQVEPLLVSLVPSPPPRPIEQPRTVPLPRMIVPEIRLPEPPRIENLYMVRAEETPPPPATMTPAVASPKPMPAPPAPTLAPPRADMAYLNNPAPTYPSVSRRSGEQGRVMLRVRVSARGEVEAIEVHQSSGYSRLDDAALAAVRRWKFVPARLGERPVEGWAIVPVNFTLRG
jgi:protein TonB